MSLDDVNNPSTNPSTADVSGRDTPGDGGQSPHREGGGGRRWRLTPGTEIEPDVARWVWQRGHTGWIALGELCLIAGREGIGKSILLATLAAEITRGTLPGVFHGQPRGVLYAATEDSWRHTIMPRMIAAGVDRSRIHRVEIDEDGVVTGLSLPRDLDGLPQAAKDTDAAVLMCDPILSTLPEQISPNRSNELRRALEPLKRRAEQAGIAVPALVHFNKTQGVDGMSMIAGSRAWGEVARTAMLLAYDEDADQVVVSQVKNNLGAKIRENQAFTISDVVVETRNGDAHVGRLVWADAGSVVSAEAVLHRRADRPRGADTDEAITGFLKRAPRAQSPKEIADETGLSHGTVKTALRRLVGQKRVTDVGRGLYKID